MLLLPLACAAHRPPAPAAAEAPVSAPLETADAAPTPVAPEPTAAVEPAPGTEQTADPMGVAGGQVGQEGAPVRHVHWTEVQEKHRMVPRFPRGAGISADCTIRVTLGPDGNPTSAEPVTCPAPSSTARSKRRWGLPGTPTRSMASASQWCSP